MNKGFDAPADCGEFFYNKSRPISISKRNLPHWQQEGVFYFVTFRTYDSIPASVKSELKKAQVKWLEKYSNLGNGEVDLSSLSEDITNEYYYLFSKRLMELMDSGYGRLPFCTFELSKILANSLKYFDDVKYNLDEWVVMPNHAHILLRLKADQNLSSVLHSVKSFTANKINRELGTEGHFWAKESFDYIVRSDNQLDKFRSYIRSNPEKAKVNVHHASWL